jgi:hypothetical protein
MGIWTTIKTQATKAKDTTVGVCKAIDTTVGGVLLKTEQKITGGFTFDEEVEYAASTAAPKAKAVCDTALPAIKKGAVCTGAAVKKATSTTVSSVKKASSVVVEKTVPIIKKATPVCKSTATKVVDGTKKASTVVVGTVKSTVSKIRSLKVKPVVTVSGSGEVKEVLHVEGRVERRTA